MANQKEIRTRIGTVKNTRKITRAMKMVAGARLHRAQNRILEMRPYAVETARVLRGVVGQKRDLSGDVGLAADTDHPLLSLREVKTVLLLVVTSDRGLCGGFNASILRQAERKLRALQAEGKAVQLFIIGRKGREFFQRRGVPVTHYFAGLWDDLGLEQARLVAKRILAPYLKQEVDEIHLLYNEFMSAMTQIAVDEVLFPLSPMVSTSPAASASARSTSEGAHEAAEVEEYIFEPDKKALLDVLVPMYIEVTLLRALYESMASELGARMTAMDSATKNASDMIDELTLQYNRARQAAITTELMEIIGGAEALSA